MMVSSEGAALKLSKMVLFSPNSHSLYGMCNGLTLVSDDDDDLVVLDINMEDDIVIAECSATC